jgi:transcriptional regulator with XRE-family HTH domain
MTGLGERVRGFAAGKGLKEHHLVTQTGLGKSTIRDLWFGVADPKLSTLLLVARELGLLSVDELVGPTPAEGAFRLMR